MKKYFLIIMVFVLMCGCKQLSPEQIAEKQGLEMKVKVEKNVDEHIKKVLDGLLEHPDSYQPISTDLSLVMNNMVEYDSEAFVALRDLDHSIENFHKQQGNNTKSPQAQKEIENLKARVTGLSDTLQTIQKRPIAFEAIDAYHQFYAKDKLNRKLKRGYHFIIHKDNRITLLCDQEQMDRVKAFAKKLLAEGVNVVENE